MPEHHKYEEEELKRTFKRTQAGWPRLCLFGKKQSPIALIKKFAYHIPYPAIQLKNFHIFNNYCIANSVDTVSITFPNICYCNRPKLSGAGLKKTYTLENIHFHWPSEHTIDGIKYDVEAHFVWFADRYETFKNALMHPNGITVMAILFLKNNFTRTNNFKNIANGVKLVSKKPDVATIWKEPINLYHFLPYDHQIFYRYEGSITTPGCFEHVNWIVFKNSSNISYLDFKNLTKLYNKKGQLIVSNCRELQKINNRRISIRHIL